MIVLQSCSEIFTKLWTPYDEHTTILELNIWNKKDDNNNNRGVAQNGN